MSPSASPVRCSLINSTARTLEPFTGEEAAMKSIMHSFKDLTPKDSMEARLISQSTVLFEMDGADSMEEKAQEQKAQEQKARKGKKRSNQ